MSADLYADLPRPAIAGERCRRCGQPAALAFGREARCMPCHVDALLTRPPPVADEIAEPPAPTRRPWSRR